MKYQFSISIGKAADKNSASTKAVKDCAYLLSLRGYKDYNLFFSEETGSVKRYFSIFQELCRFYFKLEKNSIIGIQYPMLNNVFKYFIIVARLKKVKFFCITHDIESLRLGGQNKEQVRREVENLNYYNCLIVHNTSMLEWLREKGATSQMFPLGIFDYLLTETPEQTNTSSFSKTIVFAGNLAKSNFIYSLSEINNWSFNIYGPNLVKSKLHADNVLWKGEFSPDEVVYKLNGNFGLIWDGDHINKCDEILGNYLKYNNPHKFSLYLAAGLPVIAPKDSAIGKMISEHGLGILVDDLTELKSLEITAEEYSTLKTNCLKIRNEIIRGDFFLSAIDVVENALSA